MSEGDGPFGDAVAAVDECLARTGPTIWVGMEPTFTDRGSEDPTWRSEAIGGDKEARAQTLVADLARRTAGGVVMRTVGRQYAGEDRPRWSYGVYCRRDGTPLWTGPPDPLTQHTEGPGAFGDPVREPTRAADFARSLLVALERDDVLASELTIEDSNAPHRIVWRDDGKPLEEEQRSTRSCAATLSVASPSPTTDPATS